MPCASSSHVRTSRSPCASAPYSPSTSTSEATPPLNPPRAGARQSGWTGTMEGTAMAIDLRAGARALAGMVRRDASVLARDGRQIGVRVTNAIGPERSVLIYMNGTAGAPHLLDAM